MIFNSDIFFALILLLMFTMYKNNMFMMLIKLMSNLITYFYNLSNNYSSKIKMFMLNSLMYMLFLMNFLSLFSYNFSYTSQISLMSGLTTCLCLFTMLFNMISCFKAFFSHLIPNGTPILMVPFLFMIELISLMIRPLTLFIRMMANIIAGHILVMLLYVLVYNYSLIFPLTILGYTILMLVELAVSMIQSYILVTLLCLYYGD